MQNEKNISQVMSKNVVFIKTQKAKRWSFPPPGIENSRAIQTVVWHESPSMLKLEWRVLMPLPFLPQMSFWSRLMLSAFCSHVSFSPKLALVNSHRRRMFLQTRVVTFWATCVADRGLSSAPPSKNKQTKKSTQSGRERNAAMPRSSEGVAQNVKLSPSGR